MLIEDRIAAGLVGAALVVFALSRFVRARRVYGANLYQNLHHSVAANAFLLLGIACLMLGRWIPATREISWSVFVGSAFLGAAAWCLRIAGALLAAGAERLSRRSIDISGQGVMAGVSVPTVDEAIDVVDEQAGTAAETVEPAPMTRVGIL